MEFCREALLDDDLDWIIMECARGFDHQTGLKHFSEKFEVFVLDLCPTLVGIPCSRRRKYMILTCRGRSRGWQRSGNKGRRLSSRLCSAGMSSSVGMRLIALRLKLWLPIRRQKLRSSTFLLGGALESHGRTSSLQAPVFVLASGTMSPWC